MRLLVVEDDQKITYFVRKGLEQAGFAVDCAANGEDGLHLALSEPYDTAIVDIAGGLHGRKAIQGEDRRHVEGQRLDKVQRQALPQDSWLVFGPFNFFAKEAKLSLTIPPCHQKFIC